MSKTRIVSAKPKNPRNERNADRKSAEGTKRKGPMQPLGTAFASWAQIAAVCKEENGSVYRIEQKEHSLAKFLPASGEMRKLSQSIRDFPSAALDAIAYTGQWENRTRHLSINRHGKPHEKSARRRGKREQYCNNTPPFFGGEGKKNWGSDRHATPAGKMGTRKKAGKK